MSGVLLGWPDHADPPDVEAAAARALGEWAGPDDTLNPANQRRAAAVWAMWETAAAVWGVNPHPNPDLPRHLACFALALLEAGFALKTVTSSALPGIDWWCRTQFTVGGNPVRVPGMTRHAVLVVKAWVAEFGVTPGRGESPVPRAWLVTMAEAMIADGSPLALRDLVMLTWAYSGALRAGELGVIAVDDLDCHPDRIAWEFASSKGNQDGSRADDTAAVGRTGDALDPLDALDRLRTAGWNPDLPTAPIIPAVGFGRRLPDPADPTVEGIAALTVNRRLRVWAEKGGLPHPVTAHALRHSRATHLWLDGASEAQVQRVLRHRERTTTLRYITKQSPWVEPGDAKEVMLGPTGDGYADLNVPRKNPRRQQGAPVDWGGLEDRLALTDELARLGPYAPSTRRRIDDELGRWDTWQAEMGLAGTDPSAVQLLAWTAWRIDLTTTTATPHKPAGVPPKANTMRAALTCLEAGLASRGVPAGTVTGPAHDVIDGYARRADVKARAALKPAPVFSLDELEVLAFVAGCPSETDTRRWATGLAALALHPLDSGKPGTSGGFRLVPPSAVQVLDPDTRLVAVDGRDPITVTSGPKPPLDPVAALDWLAANTPANAPTILDPAALTRAKRVFRKEGGTASVSGLVALGPAVVERACWRLAAPLVRAVRAQATIAAMTAGALRYDDLAAVRLESIHSVPGGGLGCPIFDKGGPVIEGGDVWFEPDPERPALDFPAQFARLVEWLPWGARGRLATACEAKQLVAVDPPATPLAFSALIVKWLAPAAVRAGVCAELSLHSFRRSAATALWWRLRAEGVPDTQAVERVRRKLRHKNAAVTVGYIARIDPTWTAAADLPAYEPEKEMRDARTPIHVTVPHHAA